MKASKNRALATPQIESLETRDLLTTLPANFAEFQVTPKLDGAPVSLLQAPDGRLFVTVDDNDDQGSIHVVKNGNLLTTPALQLDIRSSGEHGMIGMVLDPNFDSNSHIYVIYTTTDGGLHNRLSRFTFSGDTINQNTEFVLMELDGLGAGTVHNGGGMVFGDDGKLYVGVGDNQVATNAEDMGTVLGKILRLNPDGSIPTDNPFYGSTTGNNRAIYASGIRNPFTMDVDPITGRIFVNDVGPANFEEINEVIAGADYGWPSQVAGPNKDPGFEDPIYAYLHNGTPGGCAITGGRFHQTTNPGFPAEYSGKYYFTDFCGSWIYSYDLDTGSVEEFASDLPERPVSPLVDQSDGSIYYLSIGERAIFKIEYLIEDSLIITEQPSDTQVLDGETATFSVRAAPDSPTGFNYVWQRRPAGTSGWSNIAGATNRVLTIDSTASDDGTRYRVRVSDGSEELVSEAATLTVSSGSPPEPVITLPSASATYVAGDTISFAGFATDPDESGNLPEANLTWEVTFQHDDHDHPVLGPISGTDEGSFLVPTTGETSANTWFRVHLTATDSTGLETYTSRDIFPEKSTFTLDSNIPGIELLLDGSPAGTSNDTLGVVGVQRTIGVNSPQTIGGTDYEFVGWSDGGAISHVISTPSSDTTYIATFEPIDGGATDGGATDGGGSDGGGPTCDYNGGSEVDPCEPTPEVTATFAPTANAGEFNLTVELENFTINPNAVDGPSVSNEGHMHLLIDGVKVGRFFDLVSTILVPAGDHLVEVELSTNDHQAWTIDGIPIRDGDMLTGADPPDGGGGTGDGGHDHGSHDHSANVPGAVTHFRLDEGAGTQGGDAAFSGVPDTAILTNGASWSSEGFLNGAVRFDGVDDFLAVPDSTDFNDRVATKSTISLWFNADDIDRAGKQLLFKQNGSSRGLNIYLDGGQLYVGGWNDKQGWSGTFLNTAGTLESDKWYHVALVLDTDGPLVANGIRGYLEGEQFGSGDAAEVKRHLANTSLGYLDQSTRFHTGDSTPAVDQRAPFAGLIDEVRVYHRVLTDDELQTLATGTGGESTEGGTGGGGTTTPVQLSIDDVSALETDTGTNFQFTISADKVSTGNLSVRVSTENQTAMAGSDFTAITDQIATITAGNTSTTVNVAVSGDTNVEADEVFLLELTDPRYNDLIDPAQVTIADALGLGTIQNGDTAPIVGGGDGTPGTVAGAVTYFSFDEGSGTSVGDSATAGASDVGTLTNGATWAPGITGSALRFDGIDDRLVVSDSTDFNDRNVTQTTISLWFKADNVDTAGKQPLFKQNGDSRGLNMYIFEGLLYVGAWSDKVGWTGTFLSTDAIESDTWHHVALTIDGSSSIQPSRFIGYLDGQSFGSGDGATVRKHLGNNSFGSLDQSTRFHTGDSEGPDGLSAYAGLIDEVRVYHQVLTPGQILVLAGQPGPSPVPPQTVSMDGIDQVYSRLGDSNRDGFVDFADFLTLSKNFGNDQREFAWEDGDFDNTGKVDFADFLALSHNYGLA